MEPWPQLQFTNRPGTYVFMAFVGAVAIYESRRKSPIRRAIEVVLGVCVADEWAIVAIAAAILAGIISILCHAFIPGGAQKF
jgi:hypothetical protein